MTDDKHPSGAPWRNFYGRFKGKGMRAAQQAYLDEDLLALSPGAVTWDDNPERVPLELSDRFGDKDLWLEIGFGGGEHFVHMASRYPDVGIIGCEPYINGVAMLLGKIRKAGVKNIAVIAPAFSADCIETLEEINEEIKESFEEAGGETFTYIPCLNDNAAHIKALSHVITENLKGWID